jgi:hypothetical protein
MGETLRSTNKTGWLQSGMISSRPRGLSTRCIPKLWAKERGRPGRESSDSPSHPRERLICASVAIAHPQLRDVRLSTRPRVDTPEETLEPILAYKRPANSER